MTISKNQLPALACLICAMFTGCVVAQEYFRWVDENGVVQFSQNPPPAGIEASLGVVSLPRLSSAPAAPEAADAEPQEQPANSASAGYGKDAQMCSKVRESLAIMHANENIVMSNPGEEGGILLSENERLVEITRLTNMQSYYC